MRRTIYPNYIRTLLLIPKMLCKREQKICTMHEASTIFKAAYEAVQPKIFMHKSITLHENYITIQDQKIPLSNNVYIVGFGKAVLGMTAILEHKLKGRNLTGIISVPVGSLSSMGDNPILDSCIKVFEGAVNNIPDESSFHAAAKIKDLASSLTEADTLFVLISGGGSALLPAPRPPLTLEEKRMVIQLLSSKGATIEELNSVRKRLSLLKGGSLAELAKPATVIGLILSDIIGNPPGMIASGPTVQNKDDPQMPLSIIEKYNLKDQLPKSAIRLLYDIENERIVSSDFAHVHNFIVGNNQMALEASAQAALKMHFYSTIVTTELKGVASCVGKKLILAVITGLEHNMEAFNQSCDELQLQSTDKKSLWESLKSFQNQDRNICLLFGGETTVEVKGKGVGGRNQELALAAAIELHAKQPKNHILLLSAGTDGMDGPTPAAGAMATSGLVDIARNEGLEAEDFLNENDSYTFFSKAVGGKWLIQTGHTGTNVMDIVVILISK